MWGAFFSGLAVYLSQCFFRLPAGYANTEAYRQALQELEAKVGKRGQRAEGIGAALGFLCALIWCGLVFWLCVYRTHSFDGLPTQCVLTPEFAAWMLPMFFGSIYLVFVGTLLAPQRLLGADYLDYKRLSRLRMGNRLDYSGRIILVGLPIPILLTLGLVADNYTVFTNEAIILNPFMSFGTTTHSYRDVEKIVTAPALIAPNGDTVCRRVYVVHFKGGDKWDTDNGPNLQKYDDAKAGIADFVSRKSGVGITSLSVLPRGGL